MAASFYWYDYETFGTHPGLDRASQFAGVRTDIDLNLTGEELLIFNRLTDDYLPQAEACRVTGIGPQQVQEKGLAEIDFIRRIHAAMTTPETCLVGYNSIRFDDEFTRHTLFRNFFDPYEQEWKNGNSRWDLLDVVRLTRALRPEGINWPVHPDGKPSNRLEDLTAANDIHHTDAHDALADVHATIAVARLIRTRQPKLFDYAFTHRGKAKANAALNLREQPAVVHVSGMISGEYGHTAIVAPVTRLPENKNAIVVFDLRENPAELAELDVDAIRTRVFTAQADLPASIKRLPLKVVHVNRSPVLVPLAVLDDDSAARLQIDKPASLRHLDILRGLDVATKVAEALQPAGRDHQPDIDASLYSGGFFSDGDRRKFATIRSLSATELQDHVELFDDPRVEEMLFRYRARNWPETLNADEQKRWREHCQQYLLAKDDGGSRLQNFLAELDRLEWTAEQEALCADLKAYAEALNSHYQGC
ncbi:MAG: exodeoxyribonuclease I [Gammaproteobacteria bacterium]|nr:exodeoxyribonuclease I [Gammaproteobacteria bacterium]